MTENPAIRPEQLVGTWRRFGPAGPVYEILDAGRARSNGQRLMRVRVIESGEELDYPYAEVLDDPEEL